MKCPMISNTSSLEYQLKLASRFSFSFRDSRGFSLSAWEHSLGVRDRIAMAQWRICNYWTHYIAGPFSNTSGTLSNLRWNKISWCVNFMLKDRSAWRQWNFYTPYTLKAFNRINGLFPPATIQIYISCS